MILLEVIPVFLWLGHVLNAFLHTNIFLQVVF